LKVSGKSGLSGFRDFGRRIDDENDHDENEDGEQQSSGF